MENNDLLLILQLIRSLEYKVEALEKAYESQNKVNFDIIKKDILDIHKKINFWVENNVH